MREMPRIWPWILLGRCRPGRHARRRWPGRPAARRRPRPPPRPPCAPRPKGGPPVEAAGAGGGATLVPEPSPAGGTGPSAGSTSSVPRIMFMPQAKPKEPGRSGLSRTVVRVWAGRPAPTSRSGKTTREVHSPASRRSKTNSAGVPWRTLITSGLQPPRTVTSTRCTPPSSRAAPARRGPKKYRPRTATSTAEARTTTMSTAPMRLPASHFGPLGPALGHPCQVGAERPAGPGPSGPRPAHRAEGRCR